MTKLHPLFGAGEDRNLPEGRYLYRSYYELHPLFGAGEDRNDGVAHHYRVDAETLHPLFGAGEDRNGHLLPGALPRRLLHPLFGAGEDRNYNPRHGELYAAIRCTRSSERVRIATTPASPPLGQSGAAPALRSG